MINNGFGDKTEYFNGKQWVYIKDYQIGDMVLVYSESGIAYLEKPKKWLKFDNNFSYEFKNRNLDLHVSKHQFMLYYDKNKKLQKIRMEDLKIKHYSDKKGWRYKIPISFSWEGNYLIDDWLLRLEVAFFSYGQYNENEGLYEIVLKSQTKANRLRLIFSKCGIVFNETKIGKKTIFIFRSNHSFSLDPLHWHDLTKRSKLVVIDEIPKWDGICHKNGSYIFFTSNKSSFDLVQMLIHSIGQSTTIHKRKRKAHYNTEYRISFLSKYSCSLRSSTGRHDMKTLNNESVSYGFEVSTGMIVLRHEDKIFVTCDSSF